MQGKLFTDGGARGNPGPAGIGAALEGPQPFKLSEYIGETTNNVAEYKALILGLKTAVEKGYTEIDLFADSELIIKQLRGEYKVKNEGLKPLYFEATKYLQQLKKYTLTHIKREYNKIADQLANEAMDNHG